MNHDADTASTALDPISAAALASSALVVPYLLSRSMSPSPDHPEIWSWYRNLRKPGFNPPDAVFPVAWLAIESSLAWSGYRMMRNPATSERNVSLALLAANVVGIGAWSRLFFGSKDFALSTVASAALGISAAGYVAQAAKVDRRAAAAGVPLVVWVAFATFLTATIWRKNR